MMSCNDLWSLNLRVRGIARRFLAPEEEKQAKSAEPEAPRKLVTKCTFTVAYRYDTVTYRIHLPKLLYITVG